MMKVSPTDEKTKSTSAQLTTARAVMVTTSVDSVALGDAFGFPLATTEEPSAPKGGLSLAVKAPRALEAVTGLQLNKDI